MKKKAPLCAVLVLVLNSMPFAFPCALFAAMSGGAAQGIKADCDNALIKYPDIYAEAPVIPEVPAPSRAAVRLEPAVGPAGEEAVWDGYFQQLGTAVKKGGLTECGTDKLELLVDGREVINSVAPDIKNAVSFVHIEIFQWQADETGAAFRDLLAEKVRGGVRVRVILDRLGSSLTLLGSLERKFVDSMRKEGIEVKVREFQLLHLDHRKVMVMDDGHGGLVAYTGGMNIGDDYQRNWHDQQTRVAGPAVGQLHRSFLDSWKNITGEKLSGFPEQRSVEGGARTYVITHVGGDTDRNIKRAYLLAINTARSLIRIEDPYFTDKDIIAALIKAATDPQRPGLKVQLVVPLKDDMQVTLHAFRSKYPDLLKAGIEVYEYQPRMEHLKVAVMDHLWATAGSSNLDPQSLKYNNEMNLIVLDRNFAEEMDRRIFDEDIARSLRITSYSPNLADAISGHLPFLAPPSPLPAGLLTL